MNIHYESTRDILLVEFSGMLDAIDLIFLYLSEDYNQALKQHNKILYDFSQITGSKLTSEDAQGLAILRKRDEQTTAGKHMIIVADHPNLTALVEDFAKIIQKVNCQVSICTSISEAERLFNK